METITFGSSPSSPSQRRLRRRHITFSCRSKRRRQPRPLVQLHRHRRLRHRVPRRGAVWRRQLLPHRLVQHQDSRQLCVGHLRRHLCRDTTHRGTTYVSFEGISLGDARLPIPNGTFALSADGSGDVRLGRPGAPVHRPEPESVGCSPALITDAA